MKSFAGFFGKSALQSAKSILGGEVDDNELRKAELDELRAEYETSGTGWFDNFVNSLNRLPRPILALGTIGLFVYGLVAPQHFELRMQAIDAIPEPLWWLLGAIVSFYFGAREMHYWRQPKRSKPKSLHSEEFQQDVEARARGNSQKTSNLAQDTATTAMQRFTMWDIPTSNSGNAAIEDWKAMMRG